MLTKITGLPGNGKTLYAIKYVKEWSERENRPVFYSGIPELKLPWTEVEPEKWFDCPPNSIILIDEAQRVFRPRSMGKDVPEHVMRLETHRHQGLDVVLITQHPLLMDTAVRRLVGKHLHVVRKWGTEAATVHEWPQVRENCDKPAGRKDSIKHAWKYDKSVYGFYKSAEVHTVKRNIPMRVYILFALPLVLAALIGYVWKFTDKKMSGTISAVESSRSASSGTVANLGAPAPARMGYENALADAKQYVYERTPRVVGLPQTAPRYDEVTQPVMAPLPAACVASASRCRCYTQQGTVLDTPEDMCREIVVSGYFVDFDDSGRRRGGEDRQGLHRADAVPVRSRPTAPHGTATLSSVPAQRVGDLAQSRLGGDKGGKS